MRLVLYGTQSDREEFERSLSALPNRCYRKIGVSDFANYDSFVTALSEDLPDCVIIAMDGAEGMEAVMAARSICERVPVVWFSNDNGFGVQSYRLGCTYFHEKPLSPQILSAAIEKCV